MKLLMIGGTRDGMYLNIVNEQCKRCIVPVLESYPHEFKIDGETATMTIKNEEVYTLRLWQMEGHGIKILALEELTDRRALLKLIEGYKPE